MPVPATELGQVQPTPDTTASKGYDVFTGPRARLAEGFLFVSGILAACNGGGAITTGTPKSAEIPTFTPNPTLKSPDVTSSPITSPKPSASPTETVTPPATATPEVTPNIPVIDPNKLIKDLKSGTIAKDYPFVSVKTLNTQFNKISDKINKINPVWVPIYKDCINPDNQNNLNADFLGNCYDLVKFAVFEADTNPDQNFATFAKSYIGWFTGGGFPFVQTPAGIDYLLQDIETWKSIIP